MLIKILPLRYKSRQRIQSRLFYFLQFENFRGKSRGERFFFMNMSKAIKRKQYIEC